MLTHMLLQICRTSGIFALHFVITWSRISILDDVPLSLSVKYFHTKLLFWCPMEVELVLVAI